MKKIIFTIAVICSFCCCNNVNTSRNSVPAYADSFPDYPENVTQNTVSNDSYNNQSNSSSTDEIVGSWNENRTDGDNYLLGHYIFNADGTGRWICTGGLDVDTDIRSVIEFTWYQDASGDIVTKDTEGKTEVLSFQEGLIVEHSAGGDVIYVKR